MQGKYTKRELAIISRDFWEHRSGKAGKPSCPLPCGGSLLYPKEKEITHPWMLRFECEKCGKWGIWTYKDDEEWKEEQKKVGEKLRKFKSKRPRYI